MTLCILFEGKVTDVDIIVLTVRNIAHTENLSDTVYTFWGKRLQMCIIVLTVRNIAHTENLSDIVYTF